MKRPSDPRNTRRSEPGPKARRGAAAGPKSGPARTRAGAPDARRSRPSADAAEETARPRPTAGQRSDGGTRGATTGAARRGAGEGTGEGRGAADRKRGPGGEGRGAADRTPGKRGPGGKSRSFASTRDGGKAGPKVRSTTPRGPIAKVGSRGPIAKVGSRGRKERPDADVASDQRRVRRKPAAEPGETVRGAGGETPPRRGSAVAQLLAGGGHGDSFTESSFRGGSRRGTDDDDAPAKRPARGERPERDDADRRPTREGPAKRPSAKRPASKTSTSKTSTRARAGEATRPASATGEARRPRSDAAPRARPGSRPAAQRPIRESAARRAASEARSPASEPSAPSASRPAREPDAAPPTGAAAKAREPATPGVTRGVRGWSEAPTGKPRRDGKAAKRQPGGAERLAPGRVRLQKVLASAGIAARRKAEDLIAAGRVTVNGRVASELGVRVDPERDQIRVDGKFVQVEKKVYFVLNKPDGVVCSAEGTQDAEGRPTVLSLLQTVPQRVYPVGRLDYHTRGVLILTNDGDLAATLTHPRHEITKTYHVKFQGRLDDAALAALGQGIALDDGVVTRPAEEVSVIKETDTNTWVQITLRQGLNRQVRRMGDAVGHPVLKLIRVAIGSVTADGLEDGEFRPLTPTEVYDLMAAASR